MCAFDCPGGEEGGCDFTGGATQGRALNLANRRHRYDASEKGRSRHRVYNTSEGGRARRRRYARSAKGLATNLAAVQRYKRKGRR